MNLTWTWHIQQKVPTDVNVKGCHSNREIAGQWRNIYCNKTKHKRLSWTSIYALKYPIHYNQVSYLSSIRMETRLSHLNLDHFGRVFYDLLNQTNTTLMWFKTLKQDSMFHTVQTLRTNLFHFASLEWTIKSNASFDEINHHGNNDPFPCLKKQAIWAVLLYLWSEISRIKT